MVRDSEHFFMFFLAIWTSSFEKFLFSSVVHFFIGSLKRLTLILFGETIYLENPKKTVK
jgi:hypothetical protein